MHRSRRYAEGLPGLEPHVAHLAVELDPVDELPREEVDGLVLRVVILDRQRMSGVDVQDLAAVAIGERPDRFVSPGLRDVLDGDRTRQTGTPRVGRFEIIQRKGARPEPRTAQTTH